MSLSQRQIKFTSNIALLIEYCRVSEIGLTFGGAFRSHSQQLLYYYGKEVFEKDGRLILIPANVVSDTMNSKHLKRLAVDFNFFIKGVLTYKKKTLQHVGDYWESLDENNKWGGNFKHNDTPHFQG